MQVLYDLCELLEDELHDIVRKGEISSTELEGAYKAVDIIKDIKTIEAMEDYSYDDYSRRNSYDGENMSYNMSRDNSYARRGRDGDGDGRYSERRGRDGRGRYSRDYSGDDKQQMLNKIDQMKKQIEQM